LYYVYYCFFEICHLENYSNLVNYFDIVESIDNANYIYLSEKLSQLKGRKLHGKRNLISQFIRNYPDYRVINIEKENLNCESFKKCIELSEEWLNQKESTLGYNDKILDLINIEQRVLKNSCNFFKYLDIGLTFIEVKREIAAFAIYSKQNQEMITLHFEKYNNKFIGSAQVINSYTAKFIENKYKYINREDDLGIPQLRFAKNSYLPDKLLIPYSLNRKD